MLLREVWRDSKTREALMQNLTEMAKSPKACLAFLTISADYLEGRPKQSVEVTAKRTTNFLEAAPPAALTPPPEEPVD